MNKKGPEQAARCRAYYLAHREEISAKDKARRAANREYFQKKGAEYRAANRARLNAHNKAFYLAHPEMKAKHREDGWAGCLLSGARQSSKTRGMDAPTITAAQIEAIWDRQGGRCAWTGILMDHKPGSPWKASLERRNNSLGYVAHNVVLAGWMVNRARHSMTEGDFAEALLVVSRAMLGSKLEIVRAS